MSFAHETKTSLVAASAELKHSCCRRAFLYGGLFGAGIFTRQRIKLVTTCVDFAELIVKWLGEQHHVAGNLYITERKTGADGERSACKITIPQRKEAERLFASFGYQPDEPETIIKSEMFRCQGCEEMFVRGVFLTSGTITDPEKGYHLEMSFTTSGAAESLSELLSAAGMPPKQMLRRSENVLYYKDSESIENFLAYIGANTAAFTIMNKKIERELRSGANRIANGELANIGKTVAAAADQISAINNLIKSGDIERIPEELKQTALLRLENEDATLLELAALHTPPITKSGVNHRLKKLFALGLGEERGKSG